MSNGITCDPTEPRVVDSLSNKAKAAFPPQVTATKDRGVYWVKSYTQPNRVYRVDVEVLECNCPRALVGKTAQAVKADGKLKWETMCKHLKSSLAAHGLLCVAANGRTTREGP